MIETTYKGILIAYNETDNKWEFTLRDRDRSYPSLALARAIIDRPEKDTNERNKFEPVEGWLTDRWAKTAGKAGKVTGVALSRYGNQRVWFVAEGGNRTKEVLENFVPKTPENEEKRAVLEQLNKEI